MGRENRHESGQGGGVSRSVLTLRKRAKPNATWSGAVEGGMAHQFADLVGFGARSPLRPEPTFNSIGGTRIHRTWVNSAKKAPQARIQRS